MEAQGIAEASRGSSLIPIHTLAGIADLMPMVVTLQDMEDGSQQGRYLGTGFWYEGGIVTAAHLLAPDDYWNGQRDELVPTRLRAFPATADGDFAWESGGFELLRESEGSLVVPDHDVCWLKVRDTPDMSGHRQRATSAAASLLLGTSDGQLQRGTVIALAASSLMGSTPVPKAMPGRIVYPRYLVEPVLPYPRYAKHDGYFITALRHELFAGGTLGVGPKELEAAWSRLIARYSGDCVNQRCYLRGQVDVEKQIWTMPGASPQFQQDPSVRYVATNCDSHEGTSGSAMLLVEGRTLRLVGMHAGRMVGYSRHWLPSIGNSAKFVPLLDFKEELDDRIASPDK